MNKTHSIEVIIKAEDNAAAVSVPASQTPEDKWEYAGIGNAFIFGKVMSTHPDLLLELLQISLPEMEIEEIISPGEEVFIKTSIDAHGVRLDIAVRDSMNRIFDVEMQLRDEKNIPRRIRYYIGSIDQTNLKPGINYKELTDTVVIFITPFDPFGKDRYRYTFRNICLEEESRLELGDGSTKVILNATGSKGDISPALKGFFDLVKGFQIPMEGTFADRVQKQVIIAKRNSAWRREFMNWEMTLLVERDKGRDEGETLRIVRQVLKKASLNQSEEKIAEDLLEERDLIHEILSIAARLEDPTAENVFAVYREKELAAPRC